MQKLIIAGAVTKDAELRRTQNGKPVLNFSVRVSNGKDKDGNWRDSTFYDASFWGERGEKMHRFIVKDLKLTVWGRPKARAHEGKVYLGIDVDDLTFQGGGEKQSHEPAAPAGLDDEIPF